MKTVLLIFALFLHSLCSYGQFLTLDFILPSTVCEEEAILIEDISGYSDRHEWDFCTGDFLSTPNFQQISTIGPVINTVTGGSYLYETGKWHGFFLNRANHGKIFRSSSTSLRSPTGTSIVELNALENALNQPESMDFIKGADGLWYAYIGHLNVGTGIIRMKFGNGLESEPTELENIGDPEGGVRIRGLELVEDEGSYYLITSNYNTNRIAVYSLGNSPFGTIESSNIHVSNSFSQLALPTGIEVYKKDGEWIAYVVSQSNGDLVRLNFGSSLENQPVFEKKYSLDLVQPRELNLIKDGAHYYLIVGSEGEPISIVELGDLNVNYGVNRIIHEGLPKSFGYAVVDSASTKHIITANTNQLNYYVFNRDCGVSQNYSEEPTPTISYSAPGTYDITLTATDEDGNSSSVTKQITVLDQQAPQIAIQTDANLCLNNTKTFSAQNLTPSQTLTAHTWDFGDGTTATGEEVTHQYTAPGTYKVRLAVEADGGCGNFVEKEFNIYEAPEPEFSFPATTLCTNGSIAFENLTPGEFNDDITWLWDFGDGTTSSEKNPSHTYTSGGTKTVTLTASILGCSASISHDLEVIEGPNVDFSATNLCFGEEVQFTNLTVGDGITSYAWDFGNGETSSEISPATTYDAPGAYTVSLTVTSVSGCSTTRTKNVTIRSLPQVDFAHAMACSGVNTAFEDQSSVAEGSISSWYWDFGDGHTATQKNPIHAYEAPGTYEVKLIVTSSYGCVDSTTQTVLVKAAPKADFDMEIGCVGTLSRFIDATVVPDGDEIVNRVWVINSATFYAVNPEVPFTQPGNYNVKLTVTSSNGCISSITKTVVIDPLPAVDFAVDNACVGEKVAFTDMTQVIGDDEVVDWQWQFGGVATSDEQHPEVVFSQAGNLLVTLTVTTARGCTESVYRTIMINGQPQAAFSVDKRVGAPPLQVNFTNSTIGTVSYQWWFGDPDNTSSTEANPTFTYTDIGRYEAKLIATNAAGCSDTASVFIETLDPKMDLAVDALNVFTIAGDLQAVMKLTNKGSITVLNFDILIDLGGQVSLKEKFSGEIVAGESINYPLSVRMSEQEAARVPYICVTLMLDETGFAEVNTENNKACKELSNEFVLLSPYPNPVEDWVYLSFVMPEQQPVTLTVMNNLGKVVEDRALANTKIGLNEYTWDLTALPAGSYVLKVKYKDSVYLRKVVIR